MYTDDTIVLSLEKLSSWFGKIKIEGTEEEQNPIQSKRKDGNTFSGCLPSCNSSQNLEDKKGVPWRGLPLRKSSGCEQKTKNRTEEEGESSQTGKNRS